jgi:ribonuclease P protein subunit POP4
VFSSERPFTPTFVQSHLKKSRNLDAKALYESRVKGKQVLLENPAREKHGRVRHAKADEKKRLWMGRLDDCGPLKGQWTMDAYKRR